MVSRFCLIKRKLDYILCIVIKALYIITYKNCGIEKACTSLKELQEKLLLLTANQPIEIFAKP